MLLFVQTRLYFTFALGIFRTLISVAPSETYRAVVRELESKQYLEIWQSNKLIRNVDLGALELHGNVYTDGKYFLGYLFWFEFTFFLCIIGEFASFIWSPDETKILYVAEKKLPKSEPLYKRKSVKKDQGSGDDPQSKVCWFSDL